MAEGKFISYLRVSTERQGKSGLGIEAQEKAISDYLNGGSWELLERFTEIESGKNNDRKALQRALQQCRMTGAKLIIAKLDRLSRDPDFIGAIMKSEIDFIACDLPEANKLTIRIMSAMAEHERQAISDRTKAALQAAKARGKKLGNPENLTAEAAVKGRIEGKAVRQKKADDFAMQTGGIIKEYRTTNKSLREIADILNDQKILTARGYAGKWTATGVKNALDRFEKVRR